MFQRAIVTRADHPRAAEPERIAAELRRHGVDVRLSGGVAEAMETAVALAGAGDLVCVVGSLFVVAEAIAHAKLMDSLSLSS
jgi:dihydrofolate synthase/folylpolyglutamate synthase